MLGSFIEKAAFFPYCTKFPEMSEAVYQPHDAILTELVFL